jgi:hypothetical protein
MIEAQESRPDGSPSSQESQVKQDKQRSSDGDDKTTTRKMMIQHQ